MQGTITTLEITYGDNGWHPHQHILLFVKPDESVPCDDRLYDSWAQVCESVGLDRPSKEHGLDLRVSKDGSGYASYVEKEGNSWKLSNELTSVNKLGHKNSRTAFQLLEHYVDGEAYAGELFKEYAMAVAGRAKHSWSPGLKAHFGIGDKTEEEEANPDNIKTEEREIIDVGYLTPAGFSLVTRYGAVGTLLSDCFGDGLIEDLMIRLASLDGVSGKYTFEDLFVRPSDQRLKVA